MKKEEELGYLVSEFESLRDMVIEEITKIKTELENLQQDFEELRRDMGGIKKRRLG
jgi:uncharacterized coiled-coil DUF342 family protein